MAKKGRFPAIAPGSGPFGGKKACLRTGSVSQRVRTGERIFRPARQKAAEILTDCKDF